MSTIPTPVTEADVLDQLMTGDHPGFSAESARAILSLRFSTPAIKRMNELAEKNRQGTLSDAERADLEKFLRVGHFVNVVQAKALISRSARNGGGKPIDG
jgi:hypothetical protein